VVAPQLRKYRSFKKARALVRGLGLKSQTQWRDYCKSGKKPNDIPVNPDARYAEHGWSNWGNWLGTGRIANQLRQFRSFTKARTFARGLGLKSKPEWIEYCKSGQKPEDIPATPSNTYADDGWAGYSDWLGISSVANRLRAA
jgi:hypothetical protein